MEKYPTEVLLQIRDNLERGLAAVLAHNAAGTIDRRGPKGEATPREAGCTSEMLLDGIEHVLKEREERA